MVQTIQAQEITLPQLSERFGLERTEDEQFFREWQDDLPELSDFEKQVLDEVKGDFLHLSQYPMLEPIVKMVVLSPLLDLANFYLPPFHITSEKPVEILAEDEEVIVKGQLDVLALFGQFWVMVIESKQAAFSLEAGRAQILAYMLGNPHPDKPTFGLITNGANFKFIKLVKRQNAQYSFSRMFDIFNPGTNDLYKILSILKRLSQEAMNT